MSSLDALAQFGILVFGLSAMFLVARKNKWGFVLGLLTQPFWFTTAFLNEQWGVFLNSIVYTGIWVYGIYNWFWKRPPIDNAAETR
jgi:nicotinamide riboside transporter PnuC